MATEAETRLKELTQAHPFPWAIVQGSLRVVDANGRGIHPKHGLDQTEAAQRHSVKASNACCNMPEPGKTIAVLLRLAEQGAKGRCSGCDLTVDPCLTCLAREARRLAGVEVK